MAGTSPSRPRLTFLDITKGVLVVAMVVYHSLNYSNQYYLAFRYISFLPPSFIFITGFLISTVYLTRDDLRPSQLYSRLLTRGGKLLALFTALNVAAQLVRGGYEDGVPVGVLDFFANCFDIYIRGSGRSAVFEVLLPIAYLLLLSPVLIWLHHRHRFGLVTATITWIGFCFCSEAHGGSGNLNLVSAGVVGMYIGQLFPNPVALGRYSVLAAAAYALYFPVTVNVGYNYMVQLLNACLALALICAASIRAGDQGWVQQRLIRLGQYSLLAYIVQIFILQIMLHFFQRPEPLSTSFLVMMFATLVLTTLIVELTIMIRRKSSRSDRCYRMIFP